MTLSHRFYKLSFWQLRQDDLQAAPGPWSSRSRTDRAEQSCRRDCLSDLETVDHRLDRSRLDDRRLRPICVAFIWRERYAVRNKLVGIGTLLVGQKAPAWNRENDRGIRGGIDAAGGIRGRAFKSSSAALRRSDFVEPGLSKIACRYCLGEIFGPFSAASASVLAFAACATFVGLPAPALGRPLAIFEAPKKQNRLVLRKSDTASF